jgi:Zn-dependent protease with chaperone function
MSQFFRGFYFDGSSSRSTPVSAQVSQSGFLLVEGADTPAVLFRDLEISPRVANGARYLRYPNGARIETGDNDQIDRLQRQWTPQKKNLVYRLESNSRTVALSVLALVAAAGVFIVYGIPALSGVIVASLPTRLDDRLGAEVLDQLDEVLFEPSALSSARQAELRSLFAGLLPASERDFRLEFRASQRIGANAIALPNAQIVFTDELIQLSDDDEMIAAIMLHEIGHVAERHSMQAVVNQAGLSMALFALTGDVNSAATTLIVLLPTVLVQSGYSRAMEWEADSYALEQMLNRGMDTNKFADIMERLVRAAADQENTAARERTGEQTESGNARMESTTASDGDAPQDERPGSLGDYFSTHPATERRIERFRKAAKARP